MVSFLLWNRLISCWVNGNQSNFLFGADCGRAWADIVDIIGDHYRISVHPLFLSLVQTVYHLFEMLFVNRFIAVLALESFVGAFTVVLFNHLLTKLFIAKSLRYAMICVFGGSFSQMVFSTVPETFIFASGFLLFWYVWVFSKENSQNTKLSTCSLVFFGICCLGITITNYLLFALGLIYLLLNRSESFKRKCCYFFEINTLVFILSMCISAIQAWFWKSPLYITQFLHAIFKTGEFEEVNYMNFSFTVSKFKDLLKQMFLFPTLAPEMVYAKLLNFGSYSLLMKFMIIPIIIGIIYCIVRYRSSLWKNRKFLFLVISLSSMFVLHYFYGANEAFIYSPHYLFIFLTLVSLVLNGLFSSDKIQSKVVVMIVPVVFLINNIYQYFKMVQINGWYYMRVIVTVDQIISSLPRLLIFVIGIAFAASKVKGWTMNKMMKAYLFTAVLGFLLCLFKYFCLT